MPTHTFFNLEKDKQKKLIDCSIEEFSKVKYPDVSINKIIMNASIPRGSFYMYFKDKDDLFEYIIEMYGKKMEKAIVNAVKNNSGDLRRTFIDLYDVFLDKIIVKNIPILFKNIFMYVNINREMFDNPENNIFNKVKDDIDTSNIKYSDLEYVFSVLLYNLFFFIGGSIKHPDCNIKKDDYLKKLDIICYGIYKEEK